MRTYNAGHDPVTTAAQFLTVTGGSVTPARAHSRHRHQAGCGR